MGRIKKRMSNLSSSDRIAIPTVVLFELQVHVLKSKNASKIAELIESFVARSIVLSLDRNTAICSARVRLG